MYKQVLSHVCRCCSHEDMNDSSCREKYSPKSRYYKNTFCEGNFGLHCYLLFQILDQQYINTVLQKILVTLKKHSHTMETMHYIGSNWLFYIFVQ